MPITWKNIAGSDLEGSALIGNSVNKSLQNLQGFLQDAESGYKDRVQAISTDERETNTDYFNDRLAELDTVSELEANKSNIDSLVQQFDGQNIDQDMIRGAYDERLTGLRTNENAEREYEMGVAKSAAAPYVDQYKALITAGDKESKKQASQLLIDQKDVFRAANVFSELANFAEAEDRETINNYQQDLLFDQGQTKLTEEKAYRKFINEAIDVRGTRNLNRQILGELLAANGIEHRAADAYAEFDKLWTSRKDVTKEQERQIQLDIDNMTTDYNLATQNREAAQQRYFADHPVDKHYSFTDGEGPDGSYANKILRENGIDQEGSVNQIQDAVDKMSTAFMTDDNGVFTEHPGWNSHMRIAAINFVAEQVSANPVYWGDTHIQESAKLLEGLATEAMETFKASYDNKDLRATRLDDDTAGATEELKKYRAGVDKVWDVVEKTNAAHKNIYTRSR